MLNATDLRKSKHRFAQTLILYWQIGMSLYFTTQPAVNNCNGMCKNWLVLLTLWIYSLQAATPKIHAGPRKLVVNGIYAMYSIVIE